MFSYSLVCAERDSPCSLLFCLGYESLEIFKTYFNARERLLYALKLDADIFVIARAPEYANALSYGDIAVAYHRAAQIISGSAAEESAPGVGLRAALDVEILGVNVLCIFCDSAHRLVGGVVGAGKVAYVNEQTEIGVCDSRDELFNAVAVLRKKPWFSTIVEMPFSAAYSVTLRQPSTRVGRACSNPQ